MLAQHVSDQVHAGPLFFEKVADHGSADLSGGSEMAAAGWASNRPDFGTKARGSRHFLAADTAEYRERVYFFRHFKTLVMQDHLAGESYAAGIVDLPLWRGAAVMQREDAATGEHGLPGVPVRAQPFVAMIAIDKNKIERFAAGKLSRCFNASRANPCYVSICYSCDFVMSNHLLRAET